MMTRREVARALGALPFIPHLKAQPGALDLQHRLLGRTGRWVVPLGLGGQASLQWTAEGIDAADIIVRAVELGVNYLDSANAYGPSQSNYGEAFRRLNLAPWQGEYNPALRERLFIATKTGRRYAQDASASAATAIKELRTSLSVMFGDGRGWAPDEAYLDCMQVHNLQTMAEVDQIYEGLDARGGKLPQRIGALAGLADYRDGTNYTGLNPDHRRQIRHIGITGHLSSPVLMYALQRDTLHLIDTVLVGVNTNDRQYGSHQYNVLPLAAARGLGVIAMKVFADGVFYGKPARFSNSAADVVLSVGKPGAVPPADLVRYPLSLPGIAVAITGIGRIDRAEPGNDQLVCNLTAALGDVLTPAQRSQTEADVAATHGTNTNYFNQRQNGLIQPANVRVEQDGERIAVKWDTAYAGADPIRSYEIWAGDFRLASLPFRPQTTREPLSAYLTADEAGLGPVRVVASVV